MTEQEAIQMLERLLDPDPWEDDGLSDKAKEALQMGIDALEKWKNLMQFCQNMAER